PFTLCKKQAPAHRRTQALCSPRRHGVHRSSRAATKSKITPHWALWSAAACLSLLPVWCGCKCPIALKAQASLRTPRESHKNLVRKTRIHSVVLRRCTEKPDASVKSPDTDPDKGSRGS